MADISFTTSRGEELITPATGRRIVDTEPCTHVLKYHHIGVAVTDIPASKMYYAKLGFMSTSHEQVMVNSSGMELHLLQADKAPYNNQNLLMDTPLEKYCGHTHASFAVPSVPAVKAYLQSQGIEISGERNMGGTVRAVFTRDLNRTTLEFERNVGAMEDIAAHDFQASMIGNARPIDHVGTRVSHPKDRWIWYAEKLGFVHEVMHYQEDPDDPLKNGRPWIARTNSGIDINLLINANMMPGNRENKLLEGAVLVPGILYAAFEVANLEASTESLKNAGVPVYSEDEVQGFGLKKGKVVSCATPTVFILDPDGSIYRLVQQA